jgi:hypothetical protein
MVFGLNADSGTVPDLDVLADGIRELLAELKALVPAALSSAGTRGPCAFLLMPQARVYGCRRRRAGVR